MNRRQLLRVAAGVLGLGGLAAFVINFGALGGYFGLPLAVLALLALWLSGQPSAEQSPSGRASPGDASPIRGPDNGRATSPLLVIGVLAALLVLCAYGLYVATFLL